MTLVPNGNGDTMNVGPEPADDPEVCADGIAMEDDVKKTKCPPRDEDVGNPTYSTKDMVCY